jgi:hypothetical protein
MEFSIPPPNQKQCKLLTNTGYGGRVPGLNFMNEVRKLWYHCAITFDIKLYLWHRTWHHTNRFKLPIRFLRRYLRYICYDSANDVMSFFLEITANFMVYDIIGTNLVHVPVTSTLHDIWALDTRLFYILAYIKAALRAGASWGRHEPAAIPSPARTCLTITD